MSACCCRETSTSVGMGFKETPAGKLEEDDKEEEDDAEIGDVLAIRCATEKRFNSRPLRNNTDVTADVTAE